MASYSRIINYIAGLVLMVFCQTAVSCDLPQGFGKEKASLTLVLPGVPGEDSAAVRNSGTRAIHLPEEISSLMRYSLEFYPPGGGNRFIYPESGTTSERVVTVELEPGLWDIAAIAWYGSDMTALDKAPQVDIQAGRENSISFTMKADDFVTPDLSGSWVNQNKNLTLLAPPESLSITLAGTTAFSGISGWNDSFFYQGYYEDADGTRHNLDQPPVSFSGPGTSSLSYAINPAALGIGRFTYYAEVSNNYTYTPVSGAPTSGTATKSIYVAAIGVVSPVGTSGPGGGIIFYYSAAGFTSNGATCHYLEAAPYELDVTEWGKNGTLVGANGTAIGTGYDNTQAILAAITSETGTAAQVCDAFTSGGKNDWFLPSQGELLALYQSGIPTGILSLGSSVQSSTETGANTAWSVGNAGGSVNSWNDPKTSTVNCRPVRAF